MTMSADEQSRVLVAAASELRFGTGAPEGRGMTGELSAQGQFAARRAALRPSVRGKEGEMRGWRSRSPLISFMAYLRLECRSKFQIA